MTGSNYIIKLSKRRYSRHFLAVLLLSVREKVRTVMLAKLKQMGELTIKPAGNLCISEHLSRISQLRLLVAAVLQDH